MIILLGKIFGYSLVLFTLPKIEPPEKINIEWTEEQLGVSHEITTLDQTVYEMTHNIVDDVFDTRLLTNIKNAIHKTPTGKYVEYWPNGQVKVKLPYKNRIANGHLHGWYENGEDAFKGYFQEGVKQGIHITFYQSQPRKPHSKARRLEFSTNGVFDGEQQRYHSSRKLALFIPYVNGEVDGTLYGWNDKGEAYVEVEYENGQLLKSPPPPNFYKKRCPCKYEIYVNEIRADFIKEANRKYGAKPFCAGGSMPNDVESFGVYFNIHMHADTEKAKEILLDLMQMLVNKVNAHEKIRPYLREYPFPLISARVSVYFLKDKFNHYKDGSVASIGTSTKNELIIDRYDPKEPKQKISEVIDFETFATAK